MSDRSDYSIEDELMRKCPHPESVIIYDRSCTQCGKTLETDVLMPGTETLTHYLTLDLTK